MAFCMTSSVIVGCAADNLAGVLLLGTLGGSIGDFLMLSLTLDILEIPLMIEMPLLAHDEFLHYQYIYLTLQRENYRILFVE